MKKSYSICALIIFCILHWLAPAHLHAQVPQIINYQGRIAVGSPALNFNGTGQFKFALVDTTGANTYWSNDGTSSGGSQPTAAVSISVTNGLYSVLLGDTTLGSGMTQPIPASVFSNPDVRLRVWFNDGTHGSQLLTPDQRIAAVGYAMMAGTVPDSSITSAKIATGAVGSTQIASGAVQSWNIAQGALTLTGSNGLTLATSAGTGSLSYSTSGGWLGNSGAPIIVQPGATTANLEIWFSPRSDGYPGTGTQVDPYDGSTAAKIDAITYPLYFNNAGTPNVTIHFLPGNYTVPHIAMRNAWHIQGSGMNNTILTLDARPGRSGGTGAMFPAAYVYQSNMSVQDMTINCNYPANNALVPSGTFTAVSLEGSDCYVQNVRVTNCGGYTEAFAIVLQGYADNPPNRCFIDNCIVESPGPSCTALSIINYGALGDNQDQTGGHPITYATEGRITNCTVEGAGIGAGIAGFNGARFANNMFFSTAIGIYQDSYPNLNSQITGNVFMSCNKAVLMATNVGLGAVSTTVRGNYISTTGNGVELDQLNSNCVVTDNIITNAGGGTYAIVTSGTSTNLTAKNNVIDPTLTTSLSTTGAVIYGNINSDGSAATGLNRALTIPSGGTISYAGTTYYSHSSSGQLIFTTSP